MLLGNLQTLISEFYALELPYRVDDFVTTDAYLARVLDSGGRHVDEKLLIAEADGEAEVSLYLAQELLERLERNDPFNRLDGGNLGDFWTAFEGVSHFIYYAWNAQREQAVTLLEMELQAEVDKFVATALLMLRQGQRGDARGLHRWLFELPKLDARLDGDELDRYRRANRYAAKYCQRFMAARGPFDEPQQSELRRFYRLSHASKIEHIEGQ